MKGHICDNCETHLDDSDYTSYGSWSYTCHTCGFTYRHGASPVQEQVEKFNNVKGEIKMSTTIALWENPISKTVTPAPKLPASQGKRIACINACGNTVTEAAIICRDCKRKAKIKKGRAEEKIRKNK